MATGIRQSAEHGWYWSYDGEPVVLLGGSEKDNLFQWTGTRLQDQLDDLVEAGGNFVRNTMSDRGEEDVSPFETSDDGSYDLDRWNESYWTRLSSFLDATATRDVIVGLTLWDQHDFNGAKWNTHAWNPANNRTLPADALPTSGGDHWQDRIEFFRTVEDGNETVLDYQERFVDEVLDYTLEYDHVIYNATNEGWAGIEWELHWAEYVLERAQHEGVKVDVGNMNLDPEDSVRKAIEYPDTFSYVELSQHNQDAAGSSGPEHYKKLQEWRTEVEEAVGPRPFNNVKIYGGFDGGNENAGTADEAVRRFWRNVLGGCAACRFHRQVAAGEATWGIGSSERARRQIRSVRMVEEVVDLCRAVPRQEALLDRTADEAYCAGVPEDSYVVYLPDGGDVTLSLGEGPHDVRYLDPETATWTDDATIDGVGSQTISPSRTQCLLVVTQPPS
ncbi:hypothetical protein [Halomarina oriensis]|uniref:Glycoside hydrolase family 5 domain-containing protein n=1 Tax=Halomarina oriensis TaxID=671145 RepID=A0A6B0GPX1_9EURY|nr:hypothetical protein [Halomarina oriensis]MWG36834.1 hypothetical protein [Halomarina oriensis]